MTKAYPSCMGEMWYYDEIGKRSVCDECIFHSACFAKSAENAKVYQKAKELIIHLPTILRLENQVNFAVVLKKVRVKRNPKARKWRLNKPVRLSMKRRAEVERVRRGIDDRPLYGRHPWK